MTEIGLLDFQIMEISIAICTVIVAVISLVAVVLIARRFLK